MTVGWTQRDLDIVETLTRRVRLLSTEQIARIWWPGASSTRITRRRLRRLAAGGLVHRVIANVQPLLPITKPLATWRPGANEPNFQRISSRAKMRWQETASPQEVFFATRLAANLFGSSAGEFPPLCHRDHDLLLGQVYAYYRTTRPAQAQFWIGEDARPKAGYRIKDPDAFLLDQSGAVVRVIESAGRYSPSQCESFHQHCLDADLPYELW